MLFEEAFSDDDDDDDDDTVRNDVVCTKII